MRLLKDRVRTSLWFAPGIAVVTAVLLATLLIAFDPKDGRDELAWYLFDGGPESARELLSTIATSLLTFTALVFSITVLVIQLASNQFSPRVIRTFLQSRMTKTTMAIFVGTFVYTMLVLSQVRTEPLFVPALATWCALVLVVVSVAVFVQYIHHIAHSVRAVAVIENIAHETRSTIDQLYSGRAETCELALPSAPADHVICNIGAPGVLAAAEHDELLELARSADAVIEIVPKVGDFIPRGSPVFRIWGPAIAEAPARAALAIESERTPVQDPGFGFRQLVDIAVRALSPGVNDPTTAVQALDQLHDLLRRLTRCAFPARTHADDSGALRLVTNEPEYADFIELALHEIRHYGASAPLVKAKLIRVLDDLLSMAPPRYQRCLTELAFLDRAGSPPRRPVRS